MIVTLAGHVDHGKTSLVKMLSGVDTDRLEQEKQRGLTIDLGFAYIDDGNIGFVDVPGHHKFIHNMVAGVAADQHAMMVIAADDGPMPQSREHLQILNLTGVSDGCIVITKTDRVTPERIDECTEEVRALVAETFLANARIFQTSVEHPSTYDDLLAHLRKTSAEKQATSPTEHFRMAIDRSFVVKGAGLVVTGTVRSGAISLDDSLHHFPSGQIVRVRSIRAQDQITHRAVAGDRCALNISGLDLDASARGDWLTALPQPAAIEASIELRVLEDFPRAVKHWTPVHVYHATSHSTGRIALLSPTRVEPGTTAIVDIICDEPLAFVHGEQVIVRDQSLDVTLGGGRIVQSRTHRLTRRRDSEHVEELKAYAAYTLADCCALLAQNAGVVDLRRLTNTWHVEDVEIDTQLAASGLIKIGETAVSRDRLQQMARDLLNEIKQHHNATPSSPGMKENEFGSVPTSLRAAVLQALTQTNKVVLEAGYFHLPDTTASLPEALQKSWQRLEPALDVAQAPSTGDLAKQWKVPQQNIEKDLKELTKRGYAVHIANHRFYLPRQLKALAETVKALCVDKPMTVREFRDQTGIGRNVAIEVLEYFDSRGFTRRRDNERIVARENL